jgi:chaperonin cofactor prefoldin
MDDRHEAVERVRAWLNEPFNLDAPLAPRAADVQAVLSSVSAAQAEIERLRGEAERCQRVGDFILKRKDLADLIDAKEASQARVAALEAGLRQLLASIDEMDPEQWHVSTVAYSAAQEALLEANSNV